MGGVTIVGLDAADVRFPTSRGLHGSDALNFDPDYSAAYVTLRTDRDDGLDGHGLTFTTGRGNEVCVAAIRSLAPLVVGESLDRIRADMRGFWRRLTSDSQLRWLGPEKGVIHLATAAIVNAVWDLWAKTEGKPLWRLLVDLSPEELVGCVDFRYIDDVLAPEEALEIVRDLRRGRDARIETMLESGYPAYTTSAGWLGYDDSMVESLVKQAVMDGFRHVKMKVGADLEADDRRAALIRRSMGPDGVLMMDANQAWGVDEAISSMRFLGHHDPWWIEEPTSPDDILGHARIRREIEPIRVATGEHVQNRIVFKQLFQAKAIDVCQLDACRVGGVNEAIAILLLAAKFGVPVCPHAGGVGLCEYVQHLALFDYVAVSGSLEDRVVEWVDHLHEHFTEPAVVREGRYLAPRAPGYSIEIRAESLAEYAFPDGPVWTDIAAGRVPFRVITMIVDAHHHFWNTARNPLPWMTPDHGAIDGIFEPATLAPSLAAHRNRPDRAGPGSRPRLGHRLPVRACRRRRLGWRRDGLAASRRPHPLPPTTRGARSSFEVPRGAPPDPR